MSASREKQTRKTSGIPAPRTAREAQQQKEERRARLMYGTIGVVLLAAIILSLIWNSNIIARTATAATVDGENYNAAQVSFHYRNAYLSLANSGWASILGLDSSQPLDEQTLNDTAAGFLDAEAGTTWQEYFMDSGLRQIASIQNALKKAGDEGFAFPDSVQEDLNASMDTLTTNARASGVSTTRYLQSMFGNVMTERVYRNEILRSLQYEAYTSAYQDRLEATEDEIQAEYDENPNDYDRVSYELVTIEKSIFEPEEAEEEAAEPEETAEAEEAVEETAEPEETVAEENAEESEPEEESAEPDTEGVEEETAGSFEAETYNAEAEEAVEEENAEPDSAEAVEGDDDTLLIAPAPAGDTEETDAEQAEESEPEAAEPDKAEEAEPEEPEEEEEPDEALEAAQAAAEKLKVDFRAGGDLETLAAAIEGAVYEKEEEGDYQSLSYTSATMADWLFDSARKSRESKAITEGDTCYVVVFRNRHRDEEKTVDVRHILIRPEEGTLTEEDEGYAEEQEQLMADALVEAERILAEWKDGDATEDTFAALAKEYSDDNADEGGLYQRIAHTDSMADSFLDWCFDPQRKPGDTGIIESTYGYHIMYYVADDMPTWRKEVWDTLTSQAYSDWSESLYKDAVIERNDFGMKYAL